MWSLTNGFIDIVFSVLRVLIPNKVIQLSGSLLISPFSPNFHQTSVNGMACNKKKKKNEGKKITKSFGRNH